MTGAPVEPVPVARRTNAQKWSEQLVRDGYVEFERGGGAVGFVLLFVVFPPVFAYLGWQGVFIDAGNRSVGPVLSVVVAAGVFLLGAPVILEAVFSGRPALRVDGEGVKIAGWPRWDIGWDELVASNLQRVDGQGRYTELVVTDGVVRRQRARQPALLRWVHSVNLGIRRDTRVKLWRIYYPSIVEILTWLDTEIAKRVEEPGAKHSVAWHARKSLGLVGEREPAAGRSEESNSSTRSRRRKRRLRKKR